MPKDTTRLWLFTPALGKQTFHVSSLQGWEGVSQLFELHVTFELFEQSPLFDDDVAELLDAPAVLFFDDALGDALWHGILREVELIEVASSEDRGCRYRAVLVPSFWYLTQNVRSRCFLEMSVPEIVAQVIDEAGFEKCFDDATNGSYPKRELTVQYQESDMSFISRLLEHEGIAYRVQQLPDEEIMVLTDDMSRWTEPSEHSSVEFNPRPTNVVENPGIHAITKCYRVLPEVVALREYNWRTPLFGVHAGETISEDGYGMQVIYGEHFADEDQAKRLVKLRAQEQAQRNAQYNARSSLRDLRAGHTFELTNHHDADRFNKKYLITRIRHSATMGGGSGSSAPYGAELTLQPLDVPFRPPRVTRTPKIAGLMNAKVDGEAPGTPAPIDELGRYRLLFPYDLFGEVGKPASRWVRMAQTFAGPGYGSHSPLHIGAEVVVAHIDGDPDRPIIVGAMPNADAISPVVQDNATQSITRTLGDIVVELDDDAQTEPNQTVAGGASS
jgi:type VI secretion system secreted protein VgrG